MSQTLDIAFATNTAAPKLSKNRHVALYHSKSTRNQATKHLINPHEAGIHLQLDGTADLCYEHLGRYLPAEFTHYAADHGGFVHGYFSRPIYHSTQRSWEGHTKLAIPINLTHVPKPQTSLREIPRTET